MAKYIIQQRKNGDYYFTLIADNGQSILRGVDYSSYAACVNGIHSVGKHSQEKANYNFHFIEGDGRFTLEAENGLVIGVGLSAHRNINMLYNTIELVMKYANPKLNNEIVFVTEEGKQVIFTKHPMTGKKIINKNTAMLELELLQLKMEVLLQTEIAKNNKDAYDKTNKELFDMTMRYEELEDRYDLVILEKDSLKTQLDFVKKALDRAVLKQIDISDNLKKLEIDNKRLVDQYNKIPKWIRSMFS